MATQNRVPDPKVLEVFKIRAVVMYGTKVHTMDRGGMFGKEAIKPSFYVNFVIPKEDRTFVDALEKHLKKEISPRFEIEDLDSRYFDVVEKHYGRSGKRSAEDVEVLVNHLSENYLPYVFKAKTGFDPNRIPKRYTMKNGVAENTGWERDLPHGRQVLVHAELRKTFWQGKSGLDLHLLGVLDMGEITDKAPTPAAPKFADLSEARQEEIIAQVENYRSNDTLDLSDIALPGKSAEKEPGLDV